MELRSLLVDGEGEVPPDCAARSLLRETVAAALGTLRPRDAEILSMRFGINGAEYEHTPEEIARRFFVRHVWIDSERDGWDQWLVSIRNCRNSIHSYQDRDIGDLTRLHRAIREYLAFLRDLHGSIPGYPDEAQEPYESLDDS